MPKLELLKNSFAGGEIAPELYSRVDLSLYTKAAKLLKNFYIRPSGGANNRPGTRYQGTAKYENKEIRLIPFKYSTLQNYIIELGDYYARFYTNIGAGGQILSNSYLADNYTKLLLHCEGANQGVVFIDDTGKTVINNSPTELDYMEYASDGAVQGAYVSGDTTPVQIIVENYETNLTDYYGFYGGSAGTGEGAQKEAQQFKHSSDIFCSSVSVKIKKIGTPADNIVCRIEADNGSDKPTGNLVDANAVSSMSGSALADSFTWTSFVFPATFVLSANTKYHIVLERDGARDLDNAYQWACDTGAASYGNGIPHQMNDLSWSDSAVAATSDFGFRVYKQLPTLQAYSSASTKSQGSYSLKAVGTITGSLNKALTRTIGSPLDLTGLNQIRFDIRSSRTGSNIKIGIHDTGGVTTEITPNISVAGAWQTFTWDISAVADGNKNAIDKIVITVINADAETEFYVDNMFAGSCVITDTSVKKIGLSSAYFDGGSYLTISNSSDFNLESADFTLEGFINFKTLGNAWIAGNGALTAGGWGIKYDNTAHTLAFWANNGSRATVAFAPSTSTWYHIAIVRSSGTIKLSVNGTFGAGSSYAASITSIYDLTIGRDSQASGSYLIGWQDEIRYSKGAARWINNFTPPSATNIPYEIETPYAEADLPLISYTQSADVMYLAHPTIKPKELVRIANSSWTLSDYDFTGGPFMLPNTETGKTLASSLTAIGSTATLTASGFTFQASHVGSLWQLQHYIQGQAVSGSSTTAGIKCGGTWRIITHGTWAGTVFIERSPTGAFAGEETMLRKFTSDSDFNVNTYGTEDMSNNADPFYIRIKMAITGGTCNADLTNDPFYQRGIVQVSAVAVGGVTATATIKKEIGLTSTTIDWAEGAWSDYRGWPSVVEFSPQDRLIWANTTKEPQTHWDTKIGNYTSFSRSDPLVDDDGITANLPSREVNGITSIIPLSTIIALTSSSEWGILSSTGASITPTSILHKVYGYEGSSGVRPVVIGNRAIYVQVLSTIIRDLGYELYSDSFTGADISILSNHFFGGHTIKEMAYQQNPDRLVWCVRDDGVLLSLTYMREQEVLAWTQHDTNGGADLFKSVASIPNPTNNYNELWISVARGTKRYIERMAQRMATTDPADQIFMDAAITYNASPTNNVIGLDHLNGYTVSILADGNVMNQQVVSGGTLPENLPGAYSKIHVGIPYNSDLETLNVEANLPDGTLQGRKVKVSNVVLRLQNSRGGYIGPDALTLHPISGSPMSGSIVTVYGATTALCSGEVKENLGAGYEDGGRIFLRQSDPLPITILALLPIVKTGERTGV